MNWTAESESHSEVVFFYHEHEILNSLNILNILNSHMFRLGLLMLREVRTLFSSHDPLGLG